MGVSGYIVWQLNTEGKKRGQKIRKLVLNVGLSGLRARNVRWVALRTYVGVDVRAQGAEVDGAPQGLKTSCKLYNTIELLPSTFDIARDLRDSCEMNEMIQTRRHGALLPRRGPRLLCSWHEGQTTGRVANVFRIFDCINFSWAEDNLVYTPRFILTGLSPQVYFVVGWIYHTQWFQTYNKRY